jgi:hypothetical protein
MNEPVKLFGIDFGRALGGACERSDSGSEANLDGESH